MRNGSQGKKNAKSKKTNLGEKKDIFGSEAEMLKNLILFKDDSDFVAALCVHGFFSQGIPIRTRSYKIFSV